MVETCMVMLVANPTRAMERNASAQVCMQVIDSSLRSAAWKSALAYMDQ